MQHDPNIEPMFKDTSYVWGKKRQQLQLLDIVAYKNC